ncbi:putative reverse transcriptase domain-containing protein [Tanacetum coccineum]
MYKYGGQRNYGCITTQVDSEILLTQISVDTLGRDSTISILGPSIWKSPLLFNATMSSLVQKMPPVTTRSAGQISAAPRGLRTSVQSGRGGGGGGEQGGQRGDQVVEANKGNHINNQGNNGNQDGNVVNENIQGDVRNVIVNNDQGDNEVQKLEYEFRCYAMVRVGHAAYTDRFHELTRMVAATELIIIQSVILKAGMLTEAVRTGALKKNTEKRGNSRELSRDGKVKYDNKRSTTSRAFAITASNPVKKEYSDHYKTVCPRLIRAYENRGNRPNQALAIDGGQGHRNNGNSARGRAFMLGAAKAHQDPNIMTGTFTLNNHYATTLFDSGADYSFVSTTFIPLLDIEPSNLGFTYEIENASGQLVEISKVIRGCKIEIEGHIFDIDLIPFGHESFDVIVGMDWLSRHRAELVCHEKVVRIRLPHGETLRVLGERPKEKFLRHVINGNGIHVDPNEIEAVKNWEAPRTPSEVCLFLELFSDYDCKIRFHPGKTNVVANPLNRNERVKPRRVQEMNMNIQSSIKDKILATQNEASKVVNAPAEMLRGLDDQMKCRSD